MKSCIYCHFYIAQQTILSSCYFIDKSLDSRPGVTNVVPTGTRSSARTK